MAYLTTLQNVADELGITPGADGATDRVLDRYIRSASNMLVELCHRDFQYDASYTELLPAEGGKYLVVSNTPCQAIGSIVYDDGNDTETIDATLYDLESESAGLIRHIDGYWLDTTTYANHIEPARRHGSSQKAYQVTYEAGWVTPQQAIDSGSLTRDLPYDIEDAVIRFVVQKWQSRQRDPQVSSMSLGAGSVSYFGPEQTGSVPPEFEDVVARYKVRHV